MAGEWLPYDVCLPTKPEVVELVDRTGLEVGTVVGRMLMLWGWAALNCQDGRARISVRLLARLCGGDEEFWSAVQDVGWLDVDAEGGTVAIPGWERRFSQAAKSRDLEKARNSRANAQKPHPARSDTRAARTSTRAARSVTREARTPTRSAREREEIEEREVLPLPPCAAQGAPEATEPAGPPPGWDTLRQAWKAGKGKAWCLPTPPDKAADRLDEPGWFEKALAAIDRLPACRYFRDPVTLPQFVAPGFVDKILGGQFDNPREPRYGGRGGDAPPPPPLESWSAEDQARFEATKRKLADKLREATA